VELLELHGTVAAQGKKEYPLPMYANAWWKVRAAGPASIPAAVRAAVHDLWRAGGPRSTFWHRTFTARNMP